jgi:asparagine synthase (glutamine-hydrolysing)
VALSGDGGDESFAGYRRYRLHMMEERMRSALPEVVRRPLFSWLGRVYPKADWAPRMLRAKTTFEGMARTTVEAYFHSMCFVREPMRAQLFSQSLKSALAGYTAREVFERHARRAQCDDPLALVQYIDMHTYLVGDINTKVDRASMAHSLEVREPMMDHELVEWAARLPSELKLKGAEGKHVLKRALEPALPSEVLYRTKMGFAVPLARWFRGPLRQRVRDSLLGSRLLDSGYFDAACVQRLIDEHQSGVRDHATPLWTLLMFDAFLAQQPSQSVRTSGPALAEAA